MTVPDDSVVGALEAIEAHDSTIKAFTTVTRARALAESRNPKDPKTPKGPLAGVPFAAKNLFDIEGLTTLAGSAINRENPPAASDATAVARLTAAGAALVGATNMDEYAFGFTTENTHYGTTRNPHDSSRLAGGSSGGSAAAVAAGFATIAIGSDTNGSIRVPASLCGVFGLKPTFGRLSRAGVFPFVSSLDHVGPFARTVTMLAAAYDAMQGPDPHDPVCSGRDAEPVSALLDQGIRGLRIMRLDGYFARHASPETTAAVDAVAHALGVKAPMTWDEVERTGPASALITAAEGASVHLANLRTRPQDFDPVVRDRFLANALVPAQWIVQSQRFRRWFRDSVLKCFQQVDVLIAGATPWPALPIGQERAPLNGQDLHVRGSQGLLTRPISFIGFPSIVVPLHREGRLPIGVQVITAPWREDLAFRVAAYLESEGVVSAPVARGY